MKKAITLVFLTFLSAIGYTQQQTITICSEKNGCEFAKVNLTKHQIDNILEKSNFLAKEKGEVILNLVGCVSSIQKNKTPQDIHQAFNGKGTIKEIKDFDLRKYLFEKGCRIECKQPSVPNAGQDVLKTIELSGDFTFNQKITFSVTSSEGNLESYFYLNTKNGYSMMDNAAMQKMVTESYDGEMTQIFTSNADFYQYMKTPEGNYSMKLGSKTNVNTRTAAISFEIKKFFKEFIKTGNKRMVSNLFYSEEYIGKDEEGTPMKVWLACANDISIDKKSTNAVTGFWSLGYILSPYGITYLITGFEGKDVKISLANIEYQKASFSGKGYQPIGNMMSQAMAQNSIQENFGNESQSPEMQKMVAEMMKSNEEFAKTSDIQDLPSTKMAESVDFNANYYNMIINGLEQSKNENNKAIATLNKTPDEYTKKQISKLKCLNGCIVKEKSRYEKLKKEHLELLQQYKNNTEIRDEKISELMQNNAVPETCNCN